MGEMGFSPLLLQKTILSIKVILKILDEQTVY